MKNYYHRKLKMKKNRGVVPIRSDSHEHTYHIPPEYGSSYDFSTVNFVTLTCPVCGTNNIRQYNSHCPICNIKFSNGRIK